jgi:hypothetical protein
LAFTFIGLLSVLMRQYCILYILIFFLPQETIPYSYLHFLDHLYLFFFPLPKTFSFRSLYLSHAGSTPYRICLQTLVHSLDYCLLWLVSVQRFRLTIRKGGV